MKFCKDVYQLWNITVGFQIVQKMISGICPSSTDVPLLLPGEQMKLKTAAESLPICLLTLRTPRVPQNESGPCNTNRRLYFSVGVQLRHRIQDHFDKKFKGQTEQEQEFVPHLQGRNGRHRGEIGGTRAKLGEQGENWGHKSEIGSTGVKLGAQGQN